MLSKSFKAVRQMTKAKRVFMGPQQAMAIAQGAKPRQEKDTFGPIEVQGDRYWGA